MYVLHARNSHTSLRLGLSKAEDDNTFSKIIGTANSRIWNFTCRAKQDTFNVSDGLNIHSFVLPNPDGANVGSNSSTIRHFQSQRTRLERRIQGASCHHSPIPRHACPCCVKLGVIVCSHSPSDPTRFLVQRSAPHSIKLNSCISASKIINGKILLVPNVLREVIRYTLRYNHHSTC